MSAVLRSNRKRHRGEHWDSGGSTGRSGCRYLGCRRPTLEKRRGVYREFCGMTHRDFFMSDLADVLKEHGGARSSHVTEQQQQQICKLPGCGLEVEVDSSTGHNFDFCAKGHYFEYREQCTPQWARRGTLCKFQGCIHHVWVEEGSKRFHDFCGGTCKALAHAAKGLSSLGPQNPWLWGPSKVDAKGPSSIEMGESVFQGSAEEDAQVKLNNGRGYHIKLSEEYIETCFRHLLKNPGDYVNADPSRKTCTGVNIYDKHPWDLVKGSKGESSRFFLDSFDSTKSNEKSTIENFAWQHSGGCKNKQKRVLTKTLIYEYRGKNDTSNDHLGGYVPAYRKFNAAPKTGAPSRWRVQMSFPSEVFVDEVLGGSASSKKPMMFRVFEHKLGSPEWPPVPPIEDTQAIKKKLKTAVPELAFLGEERVMSSISSNVSPGLPPGGETLMGANSNETEVLDVVAKVQDDTHLTLVSDFLPSLDDILSNLNSGLDIDGSANMGSFFPPVDFFTCGDVPMWSDILDSHRCSDRSLSDPLGPSSGGTF